MAALMALIGAVLSVPVVIVGYVLDADTSSHAYLAFIVFIACIGIFFLVFIVFIAFTGWGSWIQGCFASQSQKSARTFSTIALFTFSGRPLA